MPLKATATPTRPEEIDRWDGGVGWIAHPEEAMQRASHALAVDDGVWVVDPVDVPDLDDRLAEFGDVAGVVCSMDRHGRDAAAVARRHGVAIHVPSFVDVGFDAPVERFDGELDDTGFRAIDANVPIPGWSEAVLFDGETLVVADVVGTADYFVAGDERLGVHPMLRVSPPRALEGLAPERILVGHGRGVMEDAAGALAGALDSARGNALRVWAKGLRGMLPG